MTDHAQRARELYEKLFLSGRDLAPIAKDLAMIEAALSQAAQEAVKDEGCSMAARIDLGHGKNGHCTIRNRPCPPRCLLKQIRHLEITVNSHAITVDSMRTVYERQLHAAQPVWGKERPTVAGWYWWRFDSASPKDMVHIMICRDGSLAEISNNGGMLAHCNFSGEWAGPLPLPREA